jgi:hypothetical protein
LHPVGIGVLNSYVVAYILPLLLSLCLSFLTEGREREEKKKKSVAKERERECRGTGEREREKIRYAGEERHRNKFNQE